MTDELPPDAEHPINYRKAFAKREALITRLEGYANNCWADNMKAEYKDLREVVYLLQSSAPVPPADGTCEIVLEECENLAGDIIQTVHLADGKEVVRSAPSPVLADGASELGRRALAACLETSQHCWCLEAGNREQIIEALRSQPIPKDILYTVLSNHIPSEMIDSIWQELSEALEVKS